MHRGLLCLLVFLPAPLLGDEPQPQSPQAEFAALSKEYEAAVEAWRKLVPKPAPAPGDLFWIEHYKLNPEWEFVPRFLAFAEAHPHDPAAAEAALIVLDSNPGGRDRAVYPCYLRARDLIIRDHLEDENVVHAFLAHPYFVTGNTESYFRALLSKSTNRETVARACMALVTCNLFRLQVAARPFFEHPEDHPEMVKRVEYLNSRYDPEYINYFKTVDVAALTQENEALLERVVREFGDIPQATPWAKPEIQARLAGRKLADLAGVRWNRIKRLAVGEVAPEIGGDDIDGRPLRLSDYRGKVVVLVWWGTWCGPCMGFLPTELALAERLKDQPFALLGINSDPDRAKLQAAVVAKGITWRSWYDGKVDGPIATSWDIHAWPTIIVIDKKGVIRFRGLPHHTPKPLDDAVDALLAEPGS